MYMYRSQSGSAWEEHLYFLDLDDSRPNVRRSLQLSSPALRVPRWRSAVHSITLEFFAPGTTEVGMAVEVVGVTEHGTKPAAIVSRLGEKVFVRGH